MKKFFVGTLVFFCILINVSFGHTLTVNDFSVEIEAGRRITTSANLGYTFINWTYSGVTLTSAQKNSPTITFTMPENNVTLTANYAEAITYQVIFDANGGTGSMKTQTFTKGVPKNLIANTFSRSGYKFVGWATLSNGLIKFVDQGIYPATRSLTLYAVWEKLDLDTITAIGDEGCIVYGVYYNHKCAVCSEKDHGCEVINIIINPGLNLDNLVPYTITAVGDAGCTVNGMYYNLKCPVCNGKDHECEVVDIIIDPGNADVVAR